MPHKANTAHRHHILRPKRRVTNWVALWRFVTQGVIPEGAVLKA
jgi:hypothetical protein